MPDFYDRVTQLVIELPPLRDSKEDLIQDLENIWNQLKFEEKHRFEKTIKKDKNLIKWIKGLDLYGNYRDLQKIAIYYKTFLDFDNDIKNMIPFKKPFQFTKNEFEEYISVNNNRLTLDFPEDKNEIEIINDYKAKLASWAIKKYIGAPNAAAHFKKIGGRITVPTIYNWKNKKPS
jgi:transcriptional regulator with AAA-type ATPase domain